MKLLNSLSKFKKNSKYQLNTSLNPNWYVVLGDNNNLHKTQSCFHQDNLYVLNPKSCFYQENNLVIVGEIWLSNSRQLASQFNLNYQSDFTCDHHLILKLWAKEGVNCLQRLQGMFAFVIWDSLTKNLSVVRDAVGSRTLYYCYQQGNYYLSPRLKSLSPFHSQDLNLVALRDYLTCAFVPGENTLWQNVQEIRPGMVLNLPDGDKQYYWQPQISREDVHQPIEFYSQKLRSLLESVVIEYLPDNQPIGIYLSGGLDSSCITALAAKFHREKIHTYSIYFGEECPNELEFSSLVASHCQTEHHIVEITPKKMWDNLPITMANLDDPIGDPLTVPNYLLAQIAQENSQIILNGEGGDPCFGGPKNQPMILSQLYNSFNGDNNLLSTYLTSYKKCFLDLPRLLKPEVYGQINNSESVFTEDLTTPTEFLNRLMLINIKFKGADHILTKVNNLTNSARLRGLSPLFDARIVALSLLIPPEYKLKGAEEKAVLKQAVLDLLPEAIIYRPKSGMRVPVQYFFYKYWKSQARRLLLSKRAIIANYVNQEIIKDWLNYQGDVWGRYGLKLWLLVSLETWLQVNQNSSK